MSRRGNRSFLSWLFLQHPTPKKEQKTTKRPHVQSPVNSPPQFPKIPQTQSSREIYLLIRSEDREDYITVNTFPATIGRVDDGETTIVIEDRSVSRRHASILLRDNTFYLIDNDSRNGVRLRGRTLTPGKAAPITHGDVFKIGRAEVRVDNVVAETDYKGNQTEMVFDNGNQNMYISQGMHESLETLHAAKPVAMPEQIYTAPGLKVSNFCTGCGSTNADMKKFCVICGKNLQN